MSNEWSLLLVFWPSFAALVVIIVIIRELTITKNLYDQIYEMGKRHGKEELAYKIYRDSLGYDEDGSDGN